jgi:hypothetical protein
MSNFLSRAGVDGNEWEEAREAAAHLRETFPQLYALFTGNEPKGDIPGVAPGGVRIFTNGGQLKAMISGKNWLNVGYLDCGKELTSLADIEAALQSGAIGWKKATERTLPY